jgi:hypothetical protein
MSIPEQNAGEPSAEPVEEKSPGEAQKPPPQARRRDPRFRVGLLAKLPTLGFTSWSAKDDFKLDEDWAGIVSLRSDAILEPLESLVPSRDD